jgi:hypothetical protein
MSADGTSAYIDEWKSPSNGAGRCGHRIVRVAIGVDSGVPIASGIAAALSADGAKLAYAASTFERRGLPVPAYEERFSCGLSVIVVRDLATGEERTFEKAPSDVGLDVTLLRWSPDSRYLAYIDPRGDVADGVVIDTSTGAIGGVQVSAELSAYVAAQLGESITPFGWTRDGELAAYVTAYPYASETKQPDHDIIATGRVASGPSCGNNTALCVVLVNNVAAISSFDYAKATAGTVRLRTNRQGKRVVGPGLDTTLPGTDPQWPAAQMFLVFG